MPLSRVASILLLAAPSSQAAVIYAQTFTGVSPSELLDDSTVSSSSGTFGGTAGATWEAGATFTTPGVLSGTARRTSAVLPFNPAQGAIYELTAVINLTNTGFLGLGFADNITPPASVPFTGNSGGQNDNNAFRFTNTTNIAGYSWIMINGTSDLTIAYSLGLTAATGTTPAYISGDALLRVVLDASDATNWVTTYYLNGSQFATSTAAAADLDAAIDSVGFTSGSGLGTISNFQLQTIPEPGSALLGGIGLLALLHRRRN